MSSASCTQLKIMGFKFYLAMAGTFVATLAITICHNSPGDVTAITLGYLAFLGGIVHFRTKEQVTAATFGAGTEGKP